jgi:DNA-binding MarR family transcriptional regulator
MVVEATDQEILQRTIDHFWETIPPVWNNVKSHVRLIATEKFEISVEQFQILRHIRRGVNSVSELANFRHISRPAVSQAINVLVDKGLLTRQHSADDRRFVELALTPGGDELLSAIFENNNIWMREKLADLHQNEINCLINAMEVLKRTFVDSES